MDIKKFFILNIGVSILNFKEILEEIEKYLEKVKSQNIKPLVIFTPNPEIVVYAQKDKRFKKIVNSAQINIPDGQGIVLASRFLGQPNLEKITGIDLLETLVEMAAKKGLRIGLIGGRPGVAVKALECLKQMCPGLLGWAEEGPRIENQNAKIKMQNYNSKFKILGDYNLNSLVGKIRQTNTKIIFVGMGAPKQEYFIMNFLRLFEDAVAYQKSPKKGTRSWGLVLMAVGGAFDYLSGQVPRAPKWVQRFGFEWFFRSIRQPWRIKRQLALIIFVVLVFKQKFIK